MARKVTRLDVGALNGAIQLPNGWLRAPAKLTRVGIFIYKSPDGSVRRELRAPEEVTKADSVATFKSLPVTNEHPPELLNATNAKRHTVGFSDSLVNVVNGFLETELTLIDDQAISDVLSGKKVQISTGYACELDETPGVWQGQPYDARQVNIVGNHIAIVPQGRAGAECCIRLDAGEMIMKVVIDGKEYDVPQEIADAIIAGTIADMMVATADAKKAEQTPAPSAADAAKMDSLTAEVAQLKAKLSGQATQARLDAERKAIETELREEIRLDDFAATAGVTLTGKLDERRKQLLAALCPSEKFDDKDRAYVHARLDIELNNKAVANVAAVRRVDNSAGSAEDKDPQAEYLQRQQSRGLRKQ